ncbi:MAG: GIY-YIG nuclease family protein, partial [Malacoplasma sp.]|nr:GIY-YIG nuclease family protein [Malacoplasma sp.]
MEMLWFFIIIPIVCFGFLIFKAVKKAQFNEELKNTFNNSKTLTTQEFFKLREKAIKMGGQSKYDRSGVYVIFNKNSQMYYVGQSINLIKRVNNHFTGKGNGDVYADYKYGAEFEITLIPCSQQDLNKVERHYIEIFNAYGKGYN